jgi:hypothetical protein
MRAFSDEAYGVPREQVIGSSVKLRYDMKDDRVSLTKLPELNSFDDREVKALNIGLHIGRRPLLAFGNSDGDLAMMRYAKSGLGPRLALFSTMTTRSGRQPTTENSGLARCPRLSTRRGITASQS